MKGYNCLEFWKVFEGKEKVFFLFDFDGTLAPLCRHHTKARMCRGDAVRLQKLKARYRIGIISGRSLRDLRRLIPFKVDFLVGNHGMENPFFPIVNKEEIVREMRQLALLLADMFPSVIIEQKIVSIALHVQRGGGSKKLLEKLKIFLKNFPELKIVGGKNVVNVLPAMSMAKGDVVRQLMVKLPMTHLIYFGDDVTDESVFNICSQRLHTVRVGCHVRSRAQYCLRHQGEVFPLLEKIIWRYCGK